MEEENNSINTNKETDKNIEYARVSLNWLYQNIENRSRDTFVDRGSCKFLAARRIQAAFRGWKVRRMVAMWHCSATNIQRVWRGFLGRRYFYCYVERLLQCQMEEYYNMNAIVMQSSWRGYWSRMMQHDHKKLKQFQERAATELIHCVAYKLHHLLRTNKIPGVYSLRNSKCLSKVEKLLACMRFKKFNAQVRLERKAYLQQMNEHMEKMRGCKTYIDVPYAGRDPTMPGEECAQLYGMPEVDRRMMEILEIYKNKKEKTSCRGLMSRSSQSAKNKEVSFCADVVDSMRRWKIMNERTMQIEPDVAQRPECIENFLNDMNQCAYE